LKPAVLAAFLTVVAFSSIVAQAQQPARATIEGIVVNATTGEAVQGARVMLSAGGGAARPGVAELIMAALASNGPPNLPTLIGGGSNPSVTTQADGKFSFSVDPGTYRVAADSNGFAPKGELPVTLTGDLDNLVLTISPPGVLEGRLTVNGEPPSSVPNLDRVRLGLWPSDSGGVFPLGPSAQVPSEGTFRFDKVPAATYKFGIAGLPASFYVEKAELNGVDMLSDAVTFSSSSSGILNVALQRGTGAIRGAVTDAQSRAAIGVEVVLVPEQRQRIDLFKTAITDKNGRFTITEVPPGNYRLFSWEAIDRYGYYDPDVLRRDEARGTAVRVSPSSNDSVDMRIIPIEP
jgi:hypothetical protein